MRCCEWPQCRRSTPLNWAATLWWRANQEAAGVCWPEAHGAAEAPSPVRCLRWTAACSKRWCRGASLWRAFLSGRSHHFPVNSILPWGAGCCSCTRSFFRSDAGPAGGLARSVPMPAARRANPASDDLYSSVPCSSSASCRSCRDNCCGCASRPFASVSEDIRAISEAFLRNASPFERIRCSQALIDRFWLTTGRATSLNCVPFCGVFCWNPMADCSMCAILPT